MNWDAAWDVLKEKKERLIMEDKVKKYIKEEYADTKMLLSRPIFVVSKSELIHESITRCYGVLMFAINNLFEDYNDELGKWWDDEMLPKFRELKNCD